MVLVLPSGWTQVLPNPSSILVSRGGSNVSAVNFTVSSVTEGSDALGDVVIQLDVDGRRVTGRGVSSDVVEASARAYLAAVNRMVRA